MAIDTNTITSDLFKSNPKMVVPPQTQDQTPYEGIIKGAIDGLPSVQTKFDEATRTSEELISGLLSRTRELDNKEGFAQEQERLAGVKDRQAELDALNEQFTDLGAQMKALSRENYAIPLKVQQNNLGTGATDIGVAPQQAGMLRENAIKALTLASEADVLGARVTNTESRLARAKENAQKAVDLKYKPIESEIARIKDFLVLNKDYILGPAEKKRTEAIETALNERTRLLDEKKENEKTINDLLINASSQGAPANLLSNARAMVAKGAKPSEVASLLGVYSGDYIGNQLKLKEMNIKDLEWKIKNNELLSYQGNAVAQNTDGTVSQGSGANSVDRNVNTVEQIIKRNAKSIPDGTQTQIANALGVINTLKELVQENPEGEFVGMYPTAGAVGTFLPDALKRKRTIANETAIGAINLKVQQWASGASLTKQQTELVYDMVPVKGDTDNVVREKIKALTDMMSSQISAQLTSAGIKYRPEPSDYFDNSISTRVRNAVGLGFDNTEIVESLANDPVYGPKIAQAKKSKYTDEQIVKQLQALK